MQNLENKKIAIVCDWIKDWGWAELVLEQLMEIFPQADIFTSVFFGENNPVFKNRKITTSFIQKIPLLNKSHKLALTLRPLAFESFDLSEYDIVISSSSAESKWVITKPDTIHICYCHTPTRYFWSHYHEYLNMMEFWVLNHLWKWLMPKIVHNLRKWDFISAQRPDYFIANSKNTALRISKYYDRNSEVIYPWVDIDDITDLKKTSHHTPGYSLLDKSNSPWPSPQGEGVKENFYLYIGRCIPYKKFDLIVDAFNENWKKLILVTNTDNKLYRELKYKSKENITWKLNISKDEKMKLFSISKAFLFPPEEDFWIVPIEAMAFWKPVIAYSKWWATETVIEWKTWVFFEEQNVLSLNKKIDEFEKLSFNKNIIRNHALSFDKKIFKKNILTFIDKII